MRNIIFYAEFKVEEEQSSSNIMQVGGMGVESEGTVKGVRSGKESDNRYVRED